MGVVGFSLSLPATRVAVPDFGPIMLSFGRAEVAALLALCVLLIRRQPLPQRRHLRPLFLTGLGVIVGFPVLTALALRSVPSAHGAIVIALLPTTTAVFGVLRARERPPKPFWIAVGFGLVAVLAFAATQGAGKPRWEDLLLLGAVVSASMGYAEGAVLAREWEGWQVISWTLVLFAPLLAPIVIYDLPRQSWDASPQAWLSLGYVSIVSMYLAFFAWYRGLALGGIARVGQTQLAQPVMTLAWSALLLGEHVGPAEIGVGVLVIASVALTRRFRYPLAV